jgi:hypothetical protein
VDPSGARPARATGASTGRRRFFGGRPRPRATGAAAVTADTRAAAAAGRAGAERTATGRATATRATGGAAGGSWCARRYQFGSASQAPSMLAPMRSYLRYKFAD